MDAPDCIPHPPIRITEHVGPNGFERVNPVTGEEEPRPGSGVVGGSGTVEDPYVIEGWCIEQPSSNAIAVEIVGTDEHVVVRENLVTGRPHPGGGLFSVVHPSQWGVVLDRVLHVDLAGNVIFQNWGAGVGVYLSAEVAITENRVEGNRAWGIQVASSNDALVRGNEIAANGRAAIELTRTRDVTVQGNRMEGSQGDPLLPGGVIRVLGSAYNLIEDNLVWGGVGPGLVSRFGSTDNEVRNNTIQDLESGAGIQLYGGTHDTVVAENTVEGVHGTGVRIGSTARGSVEGNLLVGNVVQESGEAGVSVQRADGNRFVGNQIHDNQRDGLILRGGTDGNVFEDNVFEGNTRDGVRVDARDFLPAPDSNRISHNTIRGNGEAGVALLQTMNTSVVANNLTGNEIGLVTKEPETPQINRNNIWANQGLGLDVQAGSDPVNATQNWWGCRDGPESLACDGVEGAAVVEPWLLVPNVAAGGPAG